jgi:hypothetical protein
LRSIVHLPFFNTIITIKIFTNLKYFDAHCCNLKSSPIWNILILVVVT